jgi:uncharacterized RDD family membrane protein YckC
MLLTLHGAIAWNISDWWARGLMMAHFGLFLIWQPDKVTAELKLAK